MNNLIGNCEAIAGWQPPSVADNCGGASITSLEVTGPDGSAITTFGASSGSCTDVLNFSEAFVGTSWTTTTNGGNGTIGDSSPGSISLTSSTTTGVNTTFCINIVNDGVISFDYAYGGTHDLADDHFGISTDGASTIDWFLDSNTVFGAGSSGYTAVVDNGDNFCFVIGSDGDSDSSTVTLTNFSYQCNDNWRFGEFPVGVSAVKYIAEDVCGDPVNKDSCEFTITILDVQAPVASSIDTNFFNCDPTTCDRVFGTSFVESGSFDNCGIDSSRLEQTSGPGFATSPYAGGSFTITDGPGVYSFDYIVFDSTGNSDTTTTVLVLTDVTAPTFDALPSIYTLAASSDSCFYVETGLGRNQTATDNCINPVLVYHDYAVAGDAGYVGTNDSTTLQGAVFPLGTTSVTWTSVDSFGNPSSKIVSYTVSDTTDPVLSCPTNQVVGTVPGSGCGVSVNYDVTVDDNCGIASVVSVPADGSLLGIGLTTVTTTALDNAGNSTVCTFTVTVNDSTLPVPVCSNISLTLNLLSQGSITPQQVGSATDNCGVIDSVAISQSSFDCSNLGPNSVVFTAWDPAGNSSSCTATVTVDDNFQDWRFTNCPADMELETIAGQCELNVNLNQPTVQAGCSPDSLLPRIDGVVTRDDGLSINDPYPIGSTGVRWKFISPITGDSIFCNYNVNVDDITAPTVYNCLDDQIGTDTIFEVMTDQAFCSQQQVFWDEPYALDDCLDSAQLNTQNRTRSALPGQTFPSGCTTVSYQWGDGNGNSVICEFVVCVEDTIRPEMQCNEAQIVTRAMNACGSVTVPAVDFTPGATDNCGIERRCIEIDLTDDGVDNPEIFCSPDTVLVLDCSNAPVFDTIPVRRWVEDPSGNTSDTCDGFFTVADPTIPVVSLYDTTLYTAIAAKDSCFATHTYTLPYLGCTSTGNAPQSDNSREQGSAFYYDNDTCNTIVNIEAWQVADCDGDFSAPVLIDESTVNAPEDVAYTFNFPVGKTLLVISVTDKKQTVTDTAYIAVADTIAPFASEGPADITIGTNQGQDSCYALYEWEHPKILDNCKVDSVIMIIDYPAGAIRYDGSPLNDTSIVILDDAQFGLESCPDLGSMELLFPKLTTTISYQAFDVCENCPFGLDSLTGWDCSARNEDIVWSFDVVVNDSTPVVAFDCPTSACANVDTLPIFYIEAGMTGPGLTQPNSFPDSCECFGYFDYTVKFKENCDTLTIWKHVYVYEDGQKVGPSLKSEMRVFALGDKQAPDWTYDFEISDTLFKGDYFYEVVAEDCGGFRDSCSFELKVIDKQNPEILDCTEEVTAYALSGECSADVTWDIPMNFDDNCKVIDSWSYSAQFEGQSIPITSVDPEGCNSNVGFNGQWSPGFWDWNPDNPAFGSQSFYNHTSGMLFITQGEACVEVPHDGLVSFRVADGTGTVAIAGSDIAITAGSGTGNDYTFTVSAGDTLCIDGPLMIEVTDFQFLCGGSQHSASFPVGVSTVTYVISDGMTYDSCGISYGPNYDTCVVNVTVLDTMKPWVTCIGPEVEIKLNSDGTGIFDVNDVINSADDNCKVDSMWLSAYDLTCADTAGLEVEAYVRDMSGNINSCTTTVVASPTSVPTPNSCPGSTLVYLDENCEAVLSYDVPTVNLGCYGLDTMELLTTGFHNGAVLSGELVQSVSYTYSYMTEGGIMQTLGCQFQVRVEDHLSPEFDLEVSGQMVEAGDTVHLESSGGYCFAPIHWELVNLTDNCDQNTQITSSHSAGTNLPVGCTQVTVSATDDAGNSTSRVFMVCVTDEEAPLLSCMDLTVQLDQSGQATIDSLEPIGILQDDCGITTIQLSQYTFTCDDLGDNTETVTASDAAANMTTCTYTVTVEDQISPVASCKDITIGLDQNGNASIAPGQIDNGSDDNSSCFSLSVNVNEFTCLEKGENLVTLTITDAAGLTDDCNGVVTVNDSLAAVAVYCPTDTTVFIEPGTCGAVVEYDTPQFEDNCDGLQDGMKVSGGASGSIFNAGVNSVNFTYIDSSSNVSAYCTFNITVVDNESPVIDCSTPLSLIQPTDLGVCSYTVSGSGFDVTANDNCDILSITHNYTGAPLSSTLDGAEFAAGTTVVTWIAEDLSGNKDTCEIEIEILDSQAPVLAPGSNCPADAVLAANLNECEQIYTWTPPSEALDLCDGSILRTSGQIREVLIDPKGDTSSIFPQFDYDMQPITGGFIQQAQFPVGVSRILYIASDNEGNSDTICEFTVTIQDLEVPVIICPADQILTTNCDEFPIPNYTALPNVQDNCPKNITVSQLPAQGTQLKDVQWVDNNNNNDRDEGDFFFVELIADDGSGNSDTCTFRVIIGNLTEPVPVVSPLPQITSDCGAICVDAPIAITQCGDTIHGLPSFSNGVCDENQYLFLPTSPGFINITWTYEDENGNSRTQIQNLTIMEDEIDPVVVCNDPTVYLDETGAASTDAQALLASASDNCTDSVDLTFSLSVSSFGCDDLSAPVSVTVTATDLRGNSDSCDAMVTVLDTIQPVADCVESVELYLDDQGLAVLTAQAVNAESSDNCGIELLTISQDTFDCGNIGTSTVTLTVYDATENSAQCTTSVQVSDTIAPTASCQDISVWLDGQGVATITAAEVDAGSADNCGIESLVLSIQSFECNDIGANTVWMTVTDPSGLVDSCSATVVVADSIDPVITCSSDIEDCCALQTVSASATDECSSMLTYSYVAQLANGNVLSGDTSVLTTNFPPGTSVVTFVAQDGNGNSDTCSMTVFITDDQDPVAACESDVNVALGMNGSVTLPAMFFDDGSFDEGCSSSSEIASALISVMGGTPSPSYTFTCDQVGMVDYVLIVSDCAGNTSACSGMITLENSNPALDIIPTIAKTDEIFLGEENGAINVTSVENGNGVDIFGNVTFSWAGPNGYTADTSFIDGLAPGEYCVTITNLNTSCSMDTCVDILPGFDTSMITITGTLATSYGLSAGCVDVYLNGDEQLSTQTDVNGYYQFEVAPGSYTVTPFKDIDPKEGVSTTDLIYIQGHVLKLFMLDDPYKIIAADADNNGKVSTIDLVNLQALMLGNIDQLPTNTSWKYVPVGHTFADPADPWASVIPQALPFLSLNGDVDDADFVAIKVGDVTESVTPGCSGGLNDGGGIGIESRKAMSVQLETADQAVVRGETYRVTITASEYKELLGCQLSMAFDPAVLVWKGVQEGAFQTISDASFGQKNLRDGHLLMSWFDANGVTVTEGEDLFTLVFQATANAERLSDVFNLNETGLLSNEVYERDGTSEVSLSFIGASNLEFTLMQNTPNPFRDQTMVSFVLPEAGWATLTLRDAAGRLLKTYDGQFRKGYNEIGIHRQDLPSAGLIYYQLQSGGYSATKKMIIID